MKTGTRGDFFQSINAIGSEEYPTLMTGFFEQFSILYNIIGGYDNLQISKNADQFSFNIHTPSPEIATDILSRTSGEVIQVYDRTFSIYTSQIGPTDLSIQIR